MIEERQLSNDFQTFFVSKETCISPMLVDIIQLGSKIGETILEEFECSISLSYGKRLLINSRDIDIKKVKQQDIIEIVDYDPIKNIVLAIGKNYPSIETPFHWIIQNARHDVNAVVKISNKKLYQKCSNQFPVIEKFKSYNIIDKAKVILKTLQKSKNICIKDEGILLVGLQLKEIEDLLMIIFEDLK